MRSRALAKCIIRARCFGCLGNCTQYACACDGDRCVHVKPKIDVFACHDTPDCPPGAVCKKAAGDLRGTCVGS